MNALRWLWRNTDAISSWVQIAAIIVAGYWTYNVFVKTEKPALQRTLGIDSTLSSEWANKNCVITYNVSVRNFSKSIVDVAAVRIRVWRIDRESLYRSQPGMALFDVTDLKRTQKPLMDTTYSDRLTGTYVPDAEFKRTFMWTYGSMPPGIYIFGTDVTDKHGKSLSSNDRWRPDLCGQNTRWSPQS